MTRYMLARLAWGVPVLWLVATLTFGLMHVVPGGPFDREKPLPPEIKANVEAKYHLDRPLPAQYALYLAGLVRGDLGPSYKYLGRSVSEIIAETLPVSVRLGAWAVLIALTLGVTAGLIAAVGAGGWADRAAMAGAVAGISLPGFVLGALLIELFAFELRWLPPALWEGARHAVLPAVTLALLPAGYIARLTRASLLEVLRHPYIRTAHAKGLPRMRVVLKHALPNALGPLISFLGPLVVTLITGSFVVEYIFSIPGMGRFFITAVTNRDYPLIMGVTLVYAALIVVANIAVDLVYAWIDPRVRLDGEAR